MMNKRIDPIHPGEHLAEFLDDFGVTQYRLAKEIRVPARRINEIVLGRRGVSADTALRLARFFGTSPDFWMNLQDKYELEVARARSGDEIDQIITCSA
ncbi:HigA family addiction module antitoxin [Guyparkeria hydrothermalis]|nr:HigA family addiction module antitoxin [Guyparkeria halophila]MCL7751333.1 HigA family addiction module antitoxin [Guyparkeria hydrothermalis]